MTEKERYATIGTWVEVFRKDGIEIGKSTIRRRLQQARIIGEDGRNQVGQILRAAFYSEFAVRGAVADLLQPLPQADADGFIREDGEIYGTILNLSRLLGVSQKTIISRLQKGAVPPLSGKDKSGRVQDFYPISISKRLCSNLVQDVDRADEKGFILKDGETYGTAHAFEGLFGVTEVTIKARIEKARLMLLKGKSVSGRICDFYSLSQVRPLLEDLIQEIPRAGEDGTFEKDGERYATIERLSELLGISTSAINRRLRQSPLPSVQAKTHTRILHDFYSLSEVQKLCADLIAKRQKSDV